MLKKYNISAAYKVFNVKPKDIRKSWSAIAADKSLVVITIWQHNVKSCDSAKLYYDIFDKIHQDTFDAWKSKFGNTERKKYLKHAIDNLDGLVRVIITRAKDPTAEPKKIVDCNPRKDLWFKITKFDYETGMFRIELVRDS